MTSISPDITNEPRHKSWVASANAGGDFPIQNLPYAVFRSGHAGTFRGGVAIGDRIIDLKLLSLSGALSGDAGIAAHAAAGPALNELMALGPRYWQALRRALFNALLENAPLRSSIERALVPQRDAEYSLPAHIGDYTDFYSSIHHATAVGRLLRPDDPLPPNYKWLPIGYHGRSSSIGISGDRVVRPCGQRRESGNPEPVLGPSRRLDYELEMGVFLGKGNPLGSPISIADAEAHIFGLCLLNDWSARDFQAWESQPLGPFLAKNFATLISPWVVSLQALAPYRVPHARSESDPLPLPYLDSAANRASGGMDIRLDAFLQTAAMRARGDAPERLSSTSFRHAYWTIAQLVTHHTVNGCNLRPGDIFGTGTQSGPTPGEAGSLLELSAGGKRSLRIATEERTFLEDGDTVTFRAWCAGPNAARIGFGELTGCIAPAAG